MRENVGTVDAYLRIVAGLTLFGIGLTRYPKKNGSTLLMVGGAMKVAEGITRWDPLMSLLNTGTLDGSFRRRGRYPDPGSLAYASLDGDGHERRNGIDNGEALEVSDGTEKQEEFE